MYSNSTNQKTYKVVKMVGEIEEEEKKIFGFGRKREAGWREEKQLWFLWGFYGGRL